MLRRLLLLCLLSWSASALAGGPIATTVRNEQGLTLRAWYFAPDIAAPAHAAVVMLHGCSGVYSNSRPNARSSNLQGLFVEWGRRLSAAGYAALLIDSYSARGHAQNQCGNGSEGTNEMVDRAYDALAGYRTLVGTSTWRVDPARVAVLGWSQGGTTAMSVLDISTWPAVFRMGVAFYPACGMQNAYGGIRNSMYAPYSPLHMLFGSADSFYTAGYCQTRQQRAISLGSTGFRPLWVYPDATHSFDYCTAASKSCGTADTNAKAQADPYAMELFRGL